MKERFALLLDVLVILFVFALAAFLISCRGPSAKESALARFGKDAQCVESSEDLAYCTYGGRQFICDREGCVKAPPTGQVMLELDRDRQRKQDEDDAQQQMVQ